MAKEYGQSDPRIGRYVEDLLGVDAVLDDVRARARAAGLPAIDVGLLDGRHLTVLARLGGARRAVEIGTLGGWSAICLLRGMAEGGVLDTFELEPAHAEVARESFRRAGVAAQVRLHVGPALERLPAIEGEGPFDLVFIDADKEGYADYLEWAARNLRVGGQVIADNAFLFGKIADPVSWSTAAGNAVRRMHEELLQGERWVGTVLPTGEGLAVGVRVR